MNAVRVHEYGDPEVLRYEAAAHPEPGPGEALVKIEAIGLNGTSQYSCGDGAASPRRSVSVQPGGSLWTPFNIVRGSGT